MLKRVFGLVRRLLGGRRWIYLWIGLVALSNVVIALRPTAPVPTPPGSERLMLDVPAMSASGPIAGLRYRLSVLKWTASEPAQGDEPGVIRRAIEAVKDAVTSAPPAKPAIILLHGCPSGGGADFRWFAPRLAQAGYDVFALDLPGSGASDRRAPDYSIGAMSHLVLEAMNQLEIERAHVVGWSQGGGAALVLADARPERVASLTLLASIGMQETEGSGDFAFEHVKYRIGHTLLTVLPELVPHFGLLGSRDARWAMLRPFMDSDQRPIKALMNRLRTPTLILHGRHDFLVPAWGAEEHHANIQGSTLVMLDADHFMPLGAPMAQPRAFEQSVAHLLAFVSAYDDPGVMPRRASTILSPPEAHITQKLGGIEVRRGTPWWAIIGLITIATFISEDLTTITVGLLIVSQSIDWGVGLLGCFFAIFVGDAALWLLGRTLGRRALKLPVINRVINEQSLEKWGEVLDTHTGKAVILSRFLPGTRLPTFVAAGILSRKAHVFLFWVALAAFIWTPFLILLTILIGPSVLGFFKTVFHGPWAIVAAIIVMFLIVKLIGYETTAMGRDRLKADLRRLVTIEYWPAWLFYLPLVPYFCWLSVRYGGPMTFTCANPGIPEGGGVLGESKARILRGLLEHASNVAEGAFNPAKYLAPFEFIAEDGDPDVRARRAIDSIRERADLGGYPVILKPDQGFRGYGVRLARSDDDVRAYFKVMTRDVIVQRYHPGPYELGVLWARVPARTSPVDSWEGEVFSATGKEFPVIVGDGKRTLELLIWHHPRFRMQAQVFTRRFQDLLSRVLAPGEALALGVAGNHCQGTKFIDGMPAVTHELARTLDRLARSYRDPETRAGVDFVRFDMRYTSEPELARGEGFHVVELNGTAGESTSMYDPTKSLWWTYGLLYRHWARLFRLGAARRREGVRPMRLIELWRAWRRHRAHRPGTSISD